MEYKMDNIKIHIKINDLGVNFQAENESDEVFSQVKEFNTKYNAIDKIENIEKATNMIELSNACDCANELLSFCHIINNNKVLNDILTALNLSLPISEKDMIKYGEAYGSQQDYSLEYADIVSILHYKCAEEVKYSEIIDLNDYELARFVTQLFMQDYLCNSSELPYNQCIHHNWNYEYGTEV